MRNFPYSGLDSKELLSLQRENISAAEDEKQAMLDLVSDGIDAQISAMEDLISKFKDNMSAAKDLYDYQKKIGDQTKNISNIEKQLMAYQGNTSEETKATVQKLKVSLEDAQNDLRDTEYEHYISEQGRLLDNLMDDFKETLNSRLDDTNSLLSEIIDSLNDNNVVIGDNLVELTGSVGYKLSGDMSSIWNDGIGNVQGVVTKYSDKFGTQLTGVNYTLSQINNAVAQITSASDSIAQTRDIGQISTDYLRELAVKKLFPVNTYAVEGAPEIIYKVNNPDVNRMLSNLQKSVNVQEGDTNIEFGDIVIDHPVDYADVLNKIQHDNQFQKMVVDMTLGRMRGANPLEKYKYNWK